MDTPTQPPVQPQVLQCQCPYHRRRWWSPIGALFRFIGLLILLAIVFAAGLLIGGAGPAGTLVSGPDGFGKFEFKAGGGMMGLRSAAGHMARVDSDERIFGVVTAVEGSKVTIADNGGGTQTVISTSGTVVLDGDKEVAVWTLRRGNAVRVFLDDDDGTLSAHLIEIIR